MAIELSQEVRKQLRASIKRYALENLEQDIGDLKADMLLEYFLKEIGPTVYNQAISDAQTYLAGRVADLEGVCFEKEFTYWVQPAVTRKAQ